MISSAVIKLCEAVKQAGGRALLVGGWVRDFARGVDSVDYDIEVYGLEAPALRSLIEAHGKVDAVGEAFTVYKVRLRDRELRKSFVVDVSLPRRESKTGRGHRGFVIEGDPWMRFEEAARRRDFTINAMMYDPLADEILDPYRGREDISHKIIRVVDRKTFVEDSLRVLRAMQFAARFEYSIDPATIELCRTIDLSDLPAERIWAEVEKWLLQSRRPSLGFWAARELGVTEKLWPEIHALIDCPQDPIAHPEGDVFIHTGMVLDEARKLIDDLPRPKQISVMLAALGHDLAKPYATKVESGLIKAREHEMMGVAITERFLDRLKLFTFDNYDARRQTLALVECHAVPHQWFKTPEVVTDGMFRRLALKTELDLLYRVARADCLGRRGDFKPEAEEWFIARALSLGVEEHPPNQLLMGRHVLDLGLQPGPQVGEIIRAVYEMQLDGEVVTLDDAIEAARKIIEREE
ncbi:MAG TPA: HD domain-containing protein [Blastocatellia bacterium]|jgi:tRNA nucleotidyltransferase (CCA-adding enzyme)|nr:HD domain-containing protein [Blastocatellia bacterium]